MTMKNNKTKFSKFIALAVVLALSLSVGLSGCSKEEPKEQGDAEKPVVAKNEKELGEISKASKKFEKLKSGILAYSTIMGNPTVDFASPELQYDMYLRTGFINDGDKTNYVKEDTSFIFGYNEEPMYSKMEDGKMYFYVNGAWQMSESEDYKETEIDVFSPLKPVFNEKYKDAIKSIKVTEEQGETVYTIDLHPGKYFAFLQQQNSNGEPIENPVDETNENGKINEIFSINDEGVLIGYKGLLVNEDGSEGWTIATLASYNSDADTAFYNNPFEQ